MSIWFLYKDPMFQRIQIVNSEIRKLRRKISLEDKNTDEAAEEKGGKKPAKSLGKGRKRKRSVAEEEEEEEEEHKEVKKEEEVEEKKKSGKAVAGVNRRNAVLFTRKKAATEDKTDKKDKDRIEGEEEDVKKKKTAEAEETDTFEFHEPETPREGYRGRKTRKGRELEKSILEAKAERFVGGPKIHEEMFKTYRQGGGVDTDTDTGSI